MVRNIPVPGDLPSDWLLEQLLLLLSQYASIYRAFIKLIVFQACVVHFHAFSYVVSHSEIFMPLYSIILLLVQ